MTDYKPVAPVKRVYVVDAEDADPMLYRQTQRCIDLVDRLGVGNPDARAVLDLVEFTQKHRGDSSTTAKLCAENARITERAEKAEAKVERLIDRVAAKYGGCCPHKLCPHDTYEKSDEQCRACWREWLERGE